MSQGFFGFILLFVGGVPAFAGSQHGIVEAIRRLPSLAISGGSPKRRPANPEVSDWVEECLSSGVCQLRNKKTGEIRPLPGKALSAPKKEIIPAAFEEPKLDDADKKLLEDSDVNDLDALYAKLAAANKAGKKFVILQVGNLEGCVPCKKINAAIRGSELGKDAKISIMDINQLKTRGSKLTGLLNKMGLPQVFSFPHVFVLELDGKDYASRFKGFSRDEADVDSMKAYIKSLAE